MQIFDELKVRGLQEVGFLSMDSVTGLEDGAKSIFPGVVTQRCMVHLVRNSLKYVPTSDYKDFCAHFRSMPPKSNLSVFAKSGKNIPEPLPFGNAIFLTSNSFSIILPLSEKLCTQLTRLRL